MSKLIRKVGSAPGLRLPNQPFRVARMVTERSRSFALALFLCAALFAGYCDASAYPGSDWSARGLPSPPTCAAAKMEGLPGFPDVFGSAYLALEDGCGRVVEKPLVFRVIGAQCQISDVIVGRIPVYVVDNFFGTKWSSYHVFHDHSIAINVSRAVPDDWTTVNVSPVVFGERLVWPSHLAASAAAQLIAHGIIVASKVMG